MNLAFIKKITGMLRLLEDKIIEVSQQLQDYFKSGTFGVAVYPFFMHPCVRKSRRAFLSTMAIGLAFLGVFYLFAELVSVLFTDSSIASYFKFTTLSLLSTTEVNDAPFSPLHTVMSAVFTLQGLLFAILYIIAYYTLSQRKYWLLAVIFAVFFTIGMTLSVSAQAKVTAGGLQNFGTSLTYLFGTFAIMFAGIDFKEESLGFLRRYSLQAGAVGAVCVLISLFFPNILTPILERVGIYSVMVWEILAGFALFKHK